MRGVYTANCKITSLSTAKTVLHGTLASDLCVEILDAILTNAGSSTGEQLDAGLFRVTTAGSPVGAGTVNIQKDEENDASTSVTWLGDLTTEPTAYDAAPLDYQGFNTLSGYTADLLPETRQIISPGKAFGLRLLTAPAVGFKCIAQIKYREIG